MTRKGGHFVLHTLFHPLFPLDLPVPSAGLYFARNASIGEVRVRFAGEANSSTRFHRAILFSTLCSARSESHATPDVRAQQHPGSGKSAPYGVPEGVLYNVGCRTLNYAIERFGPSSQMARLDVRHVRSQLVATHDSTTASRRRLKLSTRSKAIWAKV